MPQNQAVPTPRESDPCAVLLRHVCVQCPGLCAVGPWPGAFQYGKTREQWATSRSALLAAAHEGNTKEGEWNKCVCASGLRPLLPVLRRRQEVRQLFPWVQSRTEQNRARQQSSEGAVGMGHRRMQTTSLLPPRSPDRQARSSEPRPVRRPAMREISQGQPELWLAAWGRAEQSRAAQWQTGNEGRREGRSGGAAGGTWLCHAVPLCLSSVQLALPDFPSGRRNSASRRQV